MATPAPVEPIREFDLVPPDNARLANLCGPLDENLHLIEERLGVSVKRRGASFRIAGPHPVAPSFRICPERDVRHEHD